MTKGTKNQYPIPQYIGGKRFRLDDNGSIMSRSFTSSQIIGYGHDAQCDPPNPFTLGLDSSLSSSPNEGIDPSLPSLALAPNTIQDAPTPLRMLPCGIAMQKEELYEESNLDDPRFSSPPKVKSHTGEIPVQSTQDTYLYTPEHNFKFPSKKSHPPKSIDSSTVMSTFLAKNVYEKEGNDKVLLVLMAIGMKENYMSSKPLFDVMNDDIFDPKKNKAIKGNQFRNPFKTEMIEEVIRRKSLDGDMSKTNRQRGKSYFMNWLKTNPRTHQEDLKFLHQEAKNLKLVFLKSSGTYMITSSAGSLRSNWRGQEPRVRLIECLLCDDIRAAFVLHKTPLTRDELDGRSNPSNARPNVWALLSDKWNDEDFNPSSRVYPHLHKDYSEAMDISHNAVKDMGGCTPSKAKEKIMELKVQVSIVQRKWEASGMGGGGKKTPEEICIDETSDENDGFELRGGGDDRADFLGIFKSAVLYLWERCNEVQFLQEVIQKIKLEHSLDGGSVPIVTSGRKKRKAKKTEKDEMKEREKKDDANRATGPNLQKR